MALMEIGSGTHLIWHWFSGPLQFSITRVIVAFSMNRFYLIVMTLPHLLQNALTGSLGGGLTPKMLTCVKSCSVGLHSAVFPMERLYLL